MKTNSDKVVAPTDRLVAQRGGALAVAVHVLLLVLVLGQIVYLASRYRVRVDLTADRLWTPTDSTRRVLDKLDGRMLIEAYFSPKDNMPVALRSSREWADNFLDEVEQLGKGRVTVQRYDPNSDKAISDKATRLGIKPVNLSSRSSTSLSVDQHWQGLRLVYRGGKQEVLESFLPGSSFAAEALLTPRLKQVMTGEKRQFGYVEWPARNVGGGNQGGVGWAAVRGQAERQKRYEFRNFKDADGALLPADLSTLFLFRPHTLTDRQKYVIDQFVVGGGTLVIFADAAEYSIGPQRLMRRVPFGLDANGSQHELLEQLRHYGVDWRPRVLADMAHQAYDARRGYAQEYFSVPLRQRTGAQSFAPVKYPYFFHAVHVDWSSAAEQLATDAAGKVDGRKAEQYRKLFGPGMPADDFLFRAYQKIKRGPGFYWPTWVGLRQRAGGAVDLPEGIDGRVLMWSSPLVLLEDPPAALDPIGRDPRQMRAQHDQFLSSLRERLRAETRQQAPLMVEVSGKFSSFFAGKERPLRKSEIEEREAKKSGRAGTAAPTERDPLATAERAGRIVVIGDATFLRDDLVRGDYQDVGGPISTGARFFEYLLDWISEDRDLVELQSRTQADRTLALVTTEDGQSRDPRVAEQRLRRVTNRLVLINVLLPCGLLLGFGAVLWVLRRNHKRAFLAKVG